MAGNDCCGSANRCEDSAAICECKAEDMGGDKGKGYQPT